MILWKCCTQYASKLENSTVATVLEKSVFILITKKGDAKECSNYCTIALISHTSKVMLKILQARLQECMNFQMFKLYLEKAGEPRIKLPTSVGPSKKQGSSRKTSTSGCWLCQSLWPCGSQQTMKKYSRDGNTRPPYLPPEKSMQVTKHQLELDLGQQTGFKSGKEYIKALYCHPACLTFMQST